jgi:hypothetical protein
MTDLDRELQKLAQDVLDMYGKEALVPLAIAALDLEKQQRPTEAGPIAEALAED